LDELIMECEGLRLETVIVLPECKGEISSSYHRQMAIPQKEKEIPYAESLVLIGARGS
jgi:hypothetical protein